MGNHGLTIVELLITIILMVALTFVMVRGYANYQSAYTIESDCKKIKAFLQEVRMDAFTRKTSVNVVLGANGTQLCATAFSKCLDLNKQFSATGNITISFRGIFTGGSIWSNSRRGNPEFDCVVVSLTRARLGKWNGTSCIAQ